MCQSVSSHPNAITIIIPEQIMFRARIRPWALFSLLLVIFYLQALASCTDSSQSDIEIASGYTTTYIFNLSRLDDEHRQERMIITVTGQQRVLLNKTIEELMLSSQDGMKRIDIVNNEGQVMGVSLRIVNHSNQSQQNLNQLEEIIVESKSVFLSLQTSILATKQSMQNYMLPFNLLSQKFSQVYLEESSFNLTSTHHDYEPFLQTFWNEIGREQLLFTYLPYFSNCQFKTSRRIFLNDLVQPWLSGDYDLGEVGKICQSEETWLWGNTLTCAAKDMQVKCILEELNVKNTKKKPWWQNTESILYYFVKQNFDGKTYAQVVNKDSYLSQIEAEYYRSLIPLDYFPSFNLNLETPNSFELEISIGNIIDINNYDILQAQLFAENKPDLKLGTKQALLTIRVSYLSNMETFALFGLDQYIYFLLCTVVMVALVYLLTRLMAMCEIRLDFLQLAKLILFPITKGYIMAFFTCVCFIIIMFYIVSVTKFDSIAVTFDGDPLAGDNDKYTGRVGLNMFLVGYFLLNSGIGQSFKVLTREQTKIILEDELLEKSNPNISKDSEDEAEKQDKEDFIINNMNSHRKYLFIYLLAYPCFLLYLYETQLQFSFSMKLVAIFLVYPLIHKATVTFYRHVVTKELLYLSALMISFCLFVDTLIVGNIVMSQTAILYLCKLVSESTVYPGLEILCEWVLMKLAQYIRKFEESRSEPTRLYRLVNCFKTQILNVANECKYEKALFYANYITLRYAALLSRPFLLLIIVLTVKFNYISRDVHQTQEILIKSFSILLCLIPLDIVVMLCVVKFFEVKLGLEIVKCLEFNKFKFNRRKIKWVNDSFAQNRCVQYFYREFEKFCFSSQLYLMLFVVTFAVVTVFMGLKIILEVNYVSFIDPAMLLMVFFVWLIGTVLSIMLNFVVIKIRLYERKEDGKMRAKLQNIEKMLKKVDYSQYLELQAVKRYFLFHCKEWIINNITRIFDKEDFSENNYQLLIKYKHYKGLLKKKQIDQRKRLEHKNQQKLQKNTVKSGEKSPVVKLPLKQFNQLARPLICSWLYMAKQFTYLKSLVEDIRKSRKKDSCEFCSMNIELEVLEKNEFAQIVNEYRLLNVGRMFKQSHFVSFYTEKQEYITVCIECKDKKAYLERKQLDMAGPQRHILQKWLIMARSRLLHRHT